MFTPCCYFGCFCSWCTSVRIVSFTLVSHTWHTPISFDFHLRMHLSFLWSGHSCPCGPSTLTNVLLLYSNWVAAFLIVKAFDWRCLNHSYRNCVVSASYWFRRLNHMKVGLLHTVLSLLFKFYLSFTVEMFLPRLVFELGWLRWVLASCQLLY